MKRFEHGDRVFEIRHGWGTIGEAPQDEFLCVYFDKKKETPVWYGGENIHILSFTEYTLDGFALERPKLTWDSIWKEWMRDKTDMTFGMYLEENFEPPVRKCK
jgi:hypothetical protein